jgi:hypothetical protein
MAKPDGAIDYSDGGIEFDTTARATFRRVSLIYPRPLQPDAWKTSYEKQRPMVSAQVTTVSGDAVTLASSAAPSEPSGSTTINANNTAAWEEDEFFIADISYPNPTTDILPTPHYQRTVFSIGDASAVGRELITIGIEMQLDSAYDGEAFEIFGDTSGSWTLHDKDMPCSSYFMKYILANNMNKIAYQARSVFSVPV